MAIASKVQLKKIKALRKKLGVTNKKGHTEVHTNHGVAKNYITLLMGMLGERLAETPDVILQTCEMRSDSREACAVVGCQHTTTGRSKYCPDCTKLRKAGKIPAAVTRNFAELSCLYCHEDFTPLSSRQKCCSPECKKAYKENGNHSISLNTPTSVPKLKLKAVGVCGLVECPNPTFKSSDKKRSCVAKYCCDQCKVTANHAYNQFRAGRIDLEQLQSIVENVYFRGDNKRIDKVETPVQQELTATTFNGNDAYELAMVVVKQHAEVLYNEFIEEIKTAVVVPSFELIKTLSAPKMVCLQLEQLFADTDFVVIVSDYDKETQSAEFWVDWNKGMKRMSCAHCRQPILKKDDHSPIFNKASLRQLVKDEQVQAKIADMEIKL